MPDAVAILVGGTCFRASPWSVSLGFPHSMRARGLSGRVKGGVTIA